MHHHHAPLRHLCAWVLALVALGLAAPAAAQTTYKVALRAVANGDLLATHPNGRVAFTGTADSTRIWYLIDLNGGDLVDGDQVALRSGVNNMYLVAEGAGGGDVNVNRAKRSVWETFTLNKAWGDGDSILHTMPVTLRTHNGHYINVSTSGQLDARTRSAEREARFRMLFIERSVREARASYAEGYAAPPGAPPRPPNTGAPTGPPIPIGPPGGGGSGNSTLKPGTIGR